VTNIGESFWTSGPDLPSPVYETSVVILEEKMYVIGGEDWIERARTDTVRVFDMKSNQWSIAPPLPMPLDHSGVSTDGSKIYLVGGYTGGGPYEIPRQPSDRLFIYDPKTNQWQEGSRMSEPRAALTADFINGLLYAVGGVNSSGIPVTTNEVYDPVSNSWSETAPMPTARHHHDSAVANGQLYIIGGRVMVERTRGIPEVLTNLNDNEKFDPINKTWTIQEQMPTKRSAMDAEFFPLNGNIYVFGGEGLTGSYNITEKYDTKANEWSSEPDMPKPRRGLEAVAIDDKIYLIGGKVQGSDDVTYTVDILNINN
jgi:N-acetylneuraminic acid mutarotase